MMRPDEEANTDKDAAEYAAASEAAMDDRPAPPPLDALGHRLIGEFTQAENQRRLTEERWLEDLRQYRGQYNPETLAAIGPHRAKSFFRKTRVKVKTVDSRLSDLLFPSGSEKNWSVSPTPKSTLSPEHRADVEQALRQAQQIPVGVPVPPDVLDKACQEYADTAAKGMSKTIDDQLTEARYKASCVAAIHSGNLYGTGILKGPLVEKKVRTRFVKEAGRWVRKSESYVVPFVDYVPLWRFYPDMSATELSGCRYIFERHTMTRHEFSGLADRKTFRADVIREYIAANPNGRSNIKYFENEIKVLGERSANQGDSGNTYEVLERWGWLTSEDLRLVGVEIPPEREHEVHFSNVWLLPTGQVIKAVLQPLNGVTWPYHIYWFDKDESSFFGEGLATIMRDDQTMLNAAIRQMLDNAALTAGPQLEVAIGLLSSMEKIDEIVPFKVWKRNEKSPGQSAIRPIEIPNNLAALSNMAQMFENNADEVTAIPRYMSGENVTQGAAGTSSGLSMLMAASNIVLKDLVTSWDEGITTPFVSALYFWNMQFNSDDSIKGDFDVKARGTSSLVAKEIRTRQLNEFAAMAMQNPEDAKLIKWDKLLRQRAEANELADVVKTEEELKAEQEGPGGQLAMQMQQMQMQAQQAAVQEQMAKAQKLAAEAELAKKKIDEMMANIQLTLAQAVESKVAAAYAALQAGGVATSTPHIAPAGDEILRSAGWRDATPDTTISSLEPQGVPAMPPEQPGMTTNIEPQVNQPDAIPPAGPDLSQPTGQIGAHQGIETQSID